MFTKFTALIVLAAAGMWFWVVYRNTPPAQQRAWLLRVALMVAGGIVIGLTLAGKLPLLFVLLGAALPFAQRLITVRRIYARLKSMFEQAGKPNAGRETHQKPHEKPATPPSASATMTKEEAYEILGLEPGADALRIREAHRRLMQKMHPDRGGSTYLAARLNQAKDLLLP